MALKTNSELRKEAREALDGNWGNAVIATLIYLFVCGGISTGISFISNNSPFSSLWTLACVPLAWSYMIYFLYIIRQQKPKFGVLLDGYDNFVRIFFTLILQYIYTFLWTLLLIVPGIIKGLSYSMTAYVLKDHPELSYNAAIEESMRLMNGHKAKLFLLYLSFIGWFILACMTFCIGFILLIPYIHTSLAAFYKDLLTDESIINESVTDFNTPNSDFTEAKVDEPVLEEETQTVEDLPKPEE